MGGGGGIRTHEGLRPAGFQDRSHQPLDHPSGVCVRGNCAIAFATSKVDQIRCSSVAVALWATCASGVVPRRFGASHSEAATEDCGSTGLYIYVNLARAQAEKTQISPYRGICDTSFSCDPLPKP